MRKVAVKFHYEIGIIDLDNGNSRISGCVVVVIDMIFISKMESFEVINKVR